jgi:predicted enzyme involved in methoxymalonyl-ACP biosynthesis
MGRGVETALLAWLAEDGRLAGVQSLRGTFVPTEKNVVVRECYPQHGFRHLADGPDGSTRWELRLDDEYPAIRIPSWLKVHTPTLAR